MNCAWGFLHDLANKWEAHPECIQTWKLDSGDVNEILEATNAGLDSEGKLPEEALNDIRHIIMSLEPIKQALLFQVVIPYYANQVYATVSMCKGSGYHTRTRAIQIGIKVTNQLHPPGYALTIKVFPDCVLGDLGWADWIDNFTNRAPPDHFDAKGLQPGDILVFRAGLLSDNQEEGNEKYKQAVRGVVQDKTTAAGPHYQRVTSMRILAIAPLGNEHRAAWENFSKQSLINKLGSQSTE